MNNRAHCGQPMRYDVITDGDVFDGRRLTGTYFCERCCTMQPTYEAIEPDVTDAALAAASGKRTKESNDVK